MHLSHPFGVAGLTANTLAAILLLRFPPTPLDYTAEGWKISGGGAWSEVPQSAEEEQRGRQAYARRKNAFRAAMLFLIGGFILQLIDLLLA